MTGMSRLLNRIRRQKRKRGRIKMFSPPRVTRPQKRTAKITIKKRLRKRARMSMMRERGTMIGT